MQRVSERLAAYVWSRQRLVTRWLPVAQGQWLQVVYPGWHVPTAGPDFSEAILALPDASLLHGDVEVHSRSSEWHAHNHGANPAYDRVVAHAVLWHDADRPTVRPDGRQVPVLELAHLLSAPLDELAEECEEDALAAAPWQGACAESWRAQDYRPLLPLLERAAKDRLEQRASSLAARSSAVGRGQAWYEAWLAALNYGPNRQAGMRLAQVAPLSLLLRVSALGGRERRAELLEALLLGAAGLLPSQASVPNIAALEDARPLEELWRQAGRFGLPATMRREEWQFFRVRPDAYPTRRLAGAALWLARHLPEPERAPLAALEAWQPGDDLGRLLMVPAAPPWSRRLDFGRPCQRPRPLLVGSSHALALVASLLLPFALACFRAAGRSEAVQRVHLAYAALPAPASDQVTRHMLEQITGSATPPWPASAQRHQGLHHLHASWCAERRCDQCPVGQATRALSSP